jgi:hypothetical protein
MATPATRAGLASEKPLSAFRIAFFQNGKCFVSGRRFLWQSERCRVEGDEIVGFSKISAVFGIATARDAASGEIFFGRRESERRSWLTVYRNQRIHLAATLALKLEGGEHARRGRGIRRPTRVDRSQLFFPL